MLVHSILLIDDDPMVFEDFKKSLTGAEDLALEWVSSGPEAIELVKRFPRRFSSVISDYLMPVMNGAETNIELLKINPDLIIATYSADKTREAIKLSQSSGALEFLDKGISSETLVRTLRGYCKKFEENFQILMPDNSASQYGEKIQAIGAIGRSAKFGETAQLVEQAAGSDCNVVIFGETGTGKELLAKAIHNLSKRKSRTFIALNVATLSPELFESELFGHAKGSFTGAIGDKVGKFKLAHGGTIFLDEITELSLALQARLLRVLQDGDFYPVGSNKPERVDVRVVVASNMELESAVKKGRFREDLYYRLNVFKIKNHPLRDRPEDIRPLVLFFQKKYGGSEKVFLMRTIRKMETYKWPGNIRELENEVERIVCTLSVKTVEPVHLDAKFFLDENQVEVKAPINSYEQLRSYVQNLEKSLIMQAHRKTRCLRLTAETLGIGYSTLRTKIKEFNLTEMGV